MGVFYGDENTERILRADHQKLANIRGGPGIRVSHSPTGITISAEQRATYVASPPVLQFPLAIVSPSSNLTPGGCYGCKSTTWATSDITTPTASTYTAATLVTLAGSEDGILYHGPEMGKTTHDLTATDNTATLVLAVQGQTRSDGKKIFFGIMVYAGCS